MRGSQFKKSPCEKVSHFLGIKSFHVAIYEHLFVVDKSKLINIGIKHSVRRHKRIDQEKNCLTKLVRSPGLFTELSVRKTREHLTNSFQWTPCNKDWSLEILTYNLWLFLDSPVAWAVISQLISPSCMQPINGVWLCFENQYKSDVQKILNPGTNLTWDFTSALLRQFHASQVCCFFQPNF